MPVQRDLCRRGRSCPRCLTFAGAGVVAPGIVTVAGEGVVAPGSLYRPPNVSLAGVGVGCPRCRPRHASARRRCGRCTPARALRMAPGCAGTLCAGVTHGPGGRSLRGRYAWPRGCCNCVYMLCARPAQDTPTLPTAQAVSQTHAPASCSGRPPCAQTVLCQDWARRGLGGSRTAHSYMQCTAHPHPDTHLADFRQKSDARADHRRTRTSGG